MVHHQCYVQHCPEWKPNPLLLLLCWISCPLSSPKGDLNIHCMSNFYLLTKTKQTASLGLASCSCNCTTYSYIHYCITFTELVNRHAVLLHRVKRQLLEIGTLALNKSFYQFWGSISRLFSKRNKPQNVYGNYSAFFKFISEGVECRSKETKWVNSHQWKAYIPAYYVTKKVSGSKQEC